MDARGEPNHHAIVEGDRQVMSRVVEELVGEFGPDREVEKTSGGSRRSMSKIWLLSIRTENGIEQSYASPRVLEAIRYERGVPRASVKGFAHSKDFVA